MFQLAASSEAIGPASAVGAAPAAGGRDARGRLSPGGFSDLYHQHHRALWCIAAAIVRDKDLAHDAVQEAAMIALGKLDEFDPATSFPAWCGQVVRFVALNYRKKGRRSRVVATDPVVLAATARAGADGKTESFSAELSAALETIDETARACLLMKVVMDMSYHEIAAALGVPEGTAMSHVHRSRQALRKLLMPKMGPAGPGGEP